MWQTLQYIEKTDDVSVKVEAEKDVFRSPRSLPYKFTTSPRIIANHYFRCTDSQPLSIIGEMKAKEEEL